MRISDWSSDVCSSDLATEQEQVSNLPLLSLLIWLLIIGGGLVLALGNQRANAARWLSLLIAFVVFLLSIPLFTGFDYANAGLQFIARSEEHTTELLSLMRTSYAVLCLKLNTNYS